MTERELTPEQRTLQSLALRQLTAAADTLGRLKLIQAGQADREALADAAELVERGTDCLRDWFGGSPAEFADDLRDDLRDE